MYERGSRWTGQQDQVSVTLGHIRSHGCRELLVYCVSGRCHHATTINADHWPDKLPVRSLCARMVCTACGCVGADVRPNWSPLVNKKRALIFNARVDHLPALGRAALQMIYEPGDQLPRKL
jgi:hypothetical protein